MTSHPSKTTGSTFSKHYHRQSETDGTSPMEPLCPLATLLFMLTAATPGSTNRPFHYSYLKSETSCWLLVYTLRCCHWMSKVAMCQLGNSPLLECSCEW